MKKINFVGLKRILFMLKIKDKSKNFTAVILAAGRGKRINACNNNKAMMELAGRPMISYSVDLLKKIGFQKIIIVVGYKKEGLIKHFGKKEFIYAHQKKCLGTADAVKASLSKVPFGATDLLVIQSDDSAFYSPGVIKELIRLHKKNNNTLTFLTVVVDSPGDLGRVIRDKNGEIEGIVEAKNATPAELKTKEINTACYCFDFDFLKKHIGKVPKNKLTNEYYLPSMIKIALDQKMPIQAVVMPNRFFCGVNTPKELIYADKLMRKK